jgi:metal-responsive CopG/Arc/MetJ family transcriptional regulator
MRITINLDDRLIAQLKRRAAEQGTSVSKLVEQAVRRFVRSARTSTAPQAFESRLLEADDVERFTSTHTARTR